MGILNILYDAYKNTDNIYKSIVGDKKEYKDKYEFENSELNVRNWSITESFYLIKSLLYFKLPFRAPSWTPKYIKRFLFGGSSKYIKDLPECKDRTCMMFINGIMTNKKIILKNKEMLKKIFNRPINIIYNDTDFLIGDLLESLIDRNTKDLSDISTFALYEISKKLTDPNIERIVLLCYSQGTIITSKVLKGLSKIGLDQEIYLKKLEIYAFANCSQKMQYIKGEYPYMEHFANSNDFVAKIGCNVSEKFIKSGEVLIDGKVFIADKSGHMLNIHYINNFKNDFPDSKLNEYITSKED